jgi:hypothetical protein
MWTYHTLSYAAREATRFAIVHGRNCSVPPNSCAITVANLAARLQDAGVGLVPGELNATFTSLADNVTCNPLSTCSGNNSVFPSVGGADQGAPITVSATYPFRSALSMLWPGAGPGMVFAPISLGAESREYIQF